MGTYTNKTFTPVQRPVDLGDREFLTKEEVAKVEQERIERNRRLDEAPAERTVVGGADDASCPREGRRIRNGILQQLLAGLGHEVHGANVAHRRPPERTHSAGDARIRAAYGATPRADPRARCPQERLDRYWKRVGRQLAGLSAQRPVHRLVRGSTHDARPVQQHVHDLPNA